MKLLVCHACENFRLFGLCEVLNYFIYFPYFFHFLDLGMTGENGEVELGEAVPLQNVNGNILKKASFLF